QVMETFGMRRIRSQNFTVYCLGLLQPAGLVMAEPLLKAGRQRGIRQTHPGILASLPFTVREPWPPRAANPAGNNAARSPAATRSRAAFAAAKTAVQSPGSVCRNSRIDGYHGEVSECRK